MCRNRARLTGGRTKNTGEGRTKGVRMMGGADSRQSMRGKMVEMQRGQSRHAERTEVERARRERRENEIRSDPCGDRL